MTVVVKRSKTVKHRFGNDQFVGNLLVSCRLDVVKMQARRLQTMAEVKGERRGRHRQPEYNHTAVQHTPGKEWMVCLRHFSSITRLTNQTLD